MKRADSVLETLRRGSPEQNYGEAAARLDDAVRAGQGHVVVLGESQHEAAMFVDAVLARASGYDVAQITIRGAGAISAERLAGDAVLVVVHDADSASASDLEELRSMLERSPDAVERIRLILVGATRLEHALADPMARALNSRVGAHIRLVRKTAPRHAAPVVKRSTTKRWALVTSAVSACGALVCAAVTNFSQPAERSALIAATGEQIAALSQAVHSLVPSFDGPATTRESTAASTPAASVRLAIAAARPAADSNAHAIAAATRAPSGGSFGERFANLVEKAAYTAGLAPAAWTRASAGKPDRASATPAKKPSSRAPWVRAAAKPSVPAGSRGGVFAALARLFIRDSQGGRSVETGGAVLETVLMSAKLARGTRGAADCVLELGSFARAQSAYALKSSLADQFDRLAVARFDPPSGPIYSVRVFDFAGQTAENGPPALASGGPVAFNR